MSSLRKQHLLSPGSHRGFLFLTLKDNSALNAHDKELGSLFGKT